MPLSEDEQRILQQIEQQFYESDPEFARGVSNTTLYRHAFRNMKWATLGFVAGLVGLVATLSVSEWLSFVGFLVMLASAFWFERNARKLGRVGMQHVTKSMRASGIRSSMGNAGKRMKNRFRKED